jgi:hypothetical protein
VADQRSGALPSRSSRPATARSDQTIRPRHAALESFSGKFILKELKFTHRDLREDVDVSRRSFRPGNPSPRTRSPRSALALYLPTFEHVRDRAIFEIHMATAF